MGGKYRYGFNGKENDNEIKGDGNQQDYGMRIYDPRVGRFLSTDPISAKFPELTPYQFASNSPILNIDLDGAEALASMRDQFNAMHDGNVALFGPIRAEREDKIDRGGAALGGIYAMKFGGYTVLSIYNPGLAIPWMLSDLTGAPVLPSPQTMGGVVPSRLARVEKATEEAITNLGRRNSFSNHGGEFLDDGIRMLEQPYEPFGLNVSIGDLKGFKFNVTLDVAESNHILTAREQGVLSENIRLIINKIEDVKGGAPLKAFVETQSKLGRFRFIDQVPKAKEALVNTLKKYNTPTPDFNAASKANSQPKP